MLARLLRSYAMEREEVLLRTRRRLKRLGWPRHYLWNALTELIAPAKNTEVSQVAYRFPSPQERHVVSATYLELEARQRPLLLWMDDVQWGGDAIALAGDLGSGKSVFARAFIYALGGSGDVPSPTFTLVQMYELSPANVFHFDLYRLEKPEDAFELDIDGAFHDGISLIEWPARLGAYLPPRRLAIAFEFGASEDARLLHLDAPDAWAGRIERLQAHV